MTTRRHGITSFTQATAAQRAAATATAEKAQAALRQQWERTNQVPGNSTNAQVSMAKVVADLNVPRVQAVKTTPSPGAKTSVVAIDITTGALVSGTVVNSVNSITKGTNISNLVRDAATDPEVKGSAPSEFVNGNLSLSSI